ncbi:hypothetical protein [uncultured Brachyspira sp.]|uniref:hypothetical protein n=1 Tax=uncultured Brachyspira sp. TaxID=221953 RepID=UPI002612CFE6|nr:hypothetical protein [uncultured Brachyspira sp.]
MKIKKELYLIEFKSGSFKHKEDKSNNKKHSDFESKKYEIYKKGYGIYTSL